MKANWKRTLLSLVLCAGFVWPAGAVSTGQPAASQTGTSIAQSKPAAYTVKKSPVANTLDLYSCI